MKKLKVYISPTAKSQYLKILTRLAEEWPKKVVLEFEEMVEAKIYQVTHFPKSCRVSKKNKEIYQAVIEKHNSFYYRIKNDTIQILLFVDNRNNPSKKDKSLKQL